MVFSHVPWAPRTPGDWRTTPTDLQSSQGSPETGSEDTGTLELGFRGSVAVEGAGGREAGVTTSTLVPRAQVTRRHLLGVCLTSRLHPGRSPEGVEAKFNVVLRVGVRDWAVVVDVGSGLSGGRGWSTRSPWAGPAPCCRLLLRTRDPLQGISHTQVHPQNKNVCNHRLQASF